MNPNKLLTEPYEDLNLSDRISACHLACRAGREAAQSDAANGGEISELASPGLASDYWFYVIEPALAALSDAPVPAWAEGMQHDKHRTHVDPRVREFCAAWDDEMHDLREEAEIDAQHEAQLREQLRALASDAAQE